MSDELIDLCSRLRGLAEYAHQDVSVAAEAEMVICRLDIELRAALAKREAVAVPESRLITDASELEVGKTYWIKPANGAYFAYQPHFSRCGESGGWKYIAWPTDVSRMWAGEDNDQFTGNLIAFGPCEPPGFSLAASQQADYDPLASKDHGEALAEFDDQKCPHCQGIHDTFTPCAY